MPAPAVEIVPDGQGETLYALKRRRHKPTRQGDEHVRTNIVILNREIMTADWKLIHRTIDRYSDPARDQKSLFRF